MSASTAALRAPVFALRPAEKALLADHLAKLAAGGMPLPDGMGLLAQSGLGTRLLRRHAEVLAAHLAAGTSLSSAMATMPRSFSPEDIAPLAAGEHAGLLPDALANWAQLCTGRQRVASALHDASLYPIVVAVVAVGITAVITWKVMPTFRTLTSESGTGLPASTLIGEALIGAIHAGWPFSVLPLAGLLLARWIARRTPLAPWWDRAELALPVVGALRVAAARASLLGQVAGDARTGSGLDRAFGEAAPLQRNAWFKRELATAAARLAAGDPLSAGGPLLDARTVHALRASVASRDAGAATTRLAERETERFSRRCRRFAMVISPALTLAVGAVLGLLVAGWYAVVAASPGWVP